LPYLGLGLAEDSVLPSPAGRSFLCLLCLPLLPYPLQQHRRRLIVRVLGNQLAAEGTGQDGLIHLLQPTADGGDLRFQDLGMGEEGFDAGDDAALLGERARPAGLTAGRRMVRRRRAPSSATYLTLTKSHRVRSRLAKTKRA
jgi:hypothetical protein